MNVTPLLIFLHIAVMFAAVTLSYGVPIVMRVAYMTGQVVAVRGVGMAAGRLAPFVGPMFILGGLLGLVAAISFGQDLLAPWLVIAYVLFAAAMFIGVTENRTWGLKLGALLQTTPDGPITPEVRQMFSDTRFVAFTVADYVIVVAVIFDMVVKPFS